MQVFDTHFAGQGGEVVRQRSGWEVDQGGDIEEDTQSQEHSVGRCLNHIFVTVDNTTTSYSLPRERTKI